jgi:hypothetical protein
LADVETVGEGDLAFASWCAMWLGTRPHYVLFSAGHLSRVVGVELPDGRRVVVKIRPDQRRLAECAFVQGHLFHVGFPCPKPLVGPVPYGPDPGLVASAETYATGGQMLPPDAPGAADAYAGLLHRLIRQAPAANAVPSMQPGPPWTAWDHGGPGVWPTPDDRPDDLNEIPETAWLDEVGRRVQRRLAPFADRRPVVGHGDWEAHNLRWSDGAPAMVHDWDSVIVAPEPVVVGLAAAAWTAGAGPFPSIAQTAAFLEAYQRAAGGAWPPDEVGAAWAAGLWVRAFNEKKWRLDGHVALDEAEAAQRLRLAGAD